jgi:thioredoxin reductase
MNAENVEFVWNSEVQSIIFDAKVSGVEVKNKESGEVRTLDIDGLFISIIYIHTECFYPYSRLNIIADPSG